MLLGRKQKHIHLRCMFPFINISILKLSSDSVDRFARKISFPGEKRRSTAALDGIAVLYLINSYNILKPILLEMQHL